MNFAPPDAETLALSFVDRLRQAARGQDEAVIEDRDSVPFVDLFDDPAPPVGPPIALSLAPDLVAAAIMLARVIHPVEGLLRSLVAGAPLVTITVPSAAWVEPVRLAMRSCVLAPWPKVSRNLPHWAAHGCHGRHEALVVARDGSSTTHTSDKGNEQIGDAAQEGRAIIGIASEIHRLLPADLIRAATHDLVVVSLDPVAVAMTIEAVTGTRPASDLDEVEAAACDPADLRLAVQASRGAAGSFDRLQTIVRKKRGVAVAIGPGLSELIGYREARSWGLALVDDLRRWQKTEITFAEISSAILLSGPPGCGKTVFASALARSTGLPLRAGSLGQWQAHRDGHLGHALGAMRAFFEAARREPCIALIDEIDSFGDRAAFHSDHRNYSTQIVNALLEHLDGAVAREGVVVIATTNFPDKIDPAILRSGRLDRHVRIDLPDITDLIGIARQYLREDLRDLDLTPLAAAMRGMTGADVEAVVRRARGIARRRPDPVLTLDDLHAAIAADAPVMSDATRMRVAVHEAGHGLVSIRVGLARSVSLSVQVTGGLTETITDDSTGVSEAEIETRIVMLLAGRAAEELVLGEVSAGAAGDLAVATQLAGLMETRWGFSAERPLVSVGRADEVDILRMPWLMRPVQDRLARCYKRALDLLRAERPAVERLAAALFRTGNLEDADVRAILTTSDEARHTAPAASSADGSPASNPG